jgi:stage III sporulation protein AG
MYMVSSFIEKIKKIKHLEIYVAVLLCLIAVLIFFTDFGSKDAVITTKNWEEKILEQVNTVVSSIDGVGKVKIAITYDSGLVNEYLYETKTVSSGGNTTETKQVVNVRGEPIVLRELYPAIRGVVVVAEGGENAETRFKIIKALVTLLGVDANQVEVFGYKK